jgi:hypothetical protein
MIRSTLLALIAAFLLSAALPPPSAPTMQLSGGRWFDGAGFRPGEWFVVDGRLTRKRPPRVDVRVDLSGRHIIPPFAEAHEHDIQGAWAIRPATRKYLTAGVFYSMQMCGNPGDLAPVKGAFGHPGTVDVVFAEACISASDGHPLGMALDSLRQLKPDAQAADIWDKSYYPIDNLADLEKRWPIIAASKPDLIKLILVESERHAARRGDPKLLGSNGLDPTLVAPIVARAHAAGIRVAAHVETARDLAAAVAGGVDMIAHLPGNRMLPGTTAATYRIPDTVAADMARRGVAMITTASVLTLRKSGVDELRAVHADNLRRLRRAGVRLALGTDTFTGTVVDEIRFVDGLGVLPRAELLRIAVQDTPRLLFPKRKIGAFEEGAEASLLALDGDPLRDLSAIGRITLRIKQGAILVPPQG